MNEEFIGEVKANIKTIFKNQEEMKEDIDRLEANQESLKEITTILKFQQKQFEDHHVVVKEMHDNLVSLNSTVKNLQKDMDNVKDEVGEIRESGKFDLRKFNKEFLYKVLPGLIGVVIGGVVTTALTLWLFNK